jgi:hypothetical protein
MIKIKPKRSGNVTLVEYIKNKIKKLKKYN